MHRNPHGLAGEELLAVTAFSLLAANPSAPSCGSKKGGFPSARGSRDRHGKSYDSPYCCSQRASSNRDQLLYRQNEQHQPQTIRDTLPILLGVSSPDR